MRTIKKYSKNEQNIFPALLAEVVFALDLNPEQDFLGKLYMTLNLSNHFKGQFFTPYHVSQLMAALSLDDIMPRVKELGYITIHDSCCGGGSTLIAGINEARKILDKEGLSFQNHILVTGQDIDETVALMCYIQVSLLGLAGFFKVGNSFTEPMTYGETQKNYWFTPMYFSSVWRTRRIIKKVTELFEEKEDIVNVQDKSDDSQLEG
jgi:type I restriction-modification system DNA methylase subunit